MSAVSHWSGCAFQKAVCMRNNCVGHQSAAVETMRDDTSCHVLLVPFHIKSGHSRGPEQRASGRKSINGSLFRSSAVKVTSPVY